jgi:hypothetical protein
MGVMRAMCLVVLGACRFHSPVDGAATAVIDDSAADFAQSSQLVDAVIATRGAIEPNAYATGGLHATSYLNDATHDGAHWADVMAALPAPLAEGYGQVPRDWGTTDRPHGLALTSDDNFTIVYDGEIQLPSGDSTLVVDGDDRAIVQIAADGTNFGTEMYVRLESLSFPIHTDHAGWFPIRAVVGEGTGTATLALTLNGAAVGADILRSPVADAHGVIAFGFGDRSLTVADGEAAVATIDVDFGTNAPPYDLGQPADSFGIRFAGQLRIDTPGAYAFRVDKGTDTTDGFRLWLDGQVIAAHWSGVPDVAASPAMMLDAGWHDLLVDYAEYQMDAQVHLYMTGPDGNELIVPAAQLRPAVPFGNTVAYIDQTATGLPIADATLGGPATTTFPLTATAPANAVIDAVDVGYGLYNVRSSDLTIMLDTGGGSLAPLAPTAATTGMYQYSYYPSLAGHASQSIVPWHIVVTDSVMGSPPPMTGATGPVLFYPMICVLYHGGTAVPFAKSFTYVSSARDTPGASALGPVHLTVDLRGATLVMSVRTAATADALDAAIWVDVGDGEVPATVAGDVLQYRLVVTGDGWQFPSIDRVEIDYSD